MNKAASPSGSGLEAVLLAKAPALLRFFTSRTRDPAEAEEIMQEIGLRLGRAPPGPIGDPVGYLYRIGLDLVIDRARMRRSRSSCGDEWNEASPEKVDETSLDRPTAPFGDLSARQRSERITAVLASMPPGPARAFQMHKIEGRNHKEVADRLGITKEGVEQHMTVAFRHLARELQE